MSTQIDQLAPAVRRILRYCAVLGRSFRREVLRAHPRGRRPHPGRRDARGAVRPSSRPTARTGSGSATAWFATRPTRGSPSGCGPGSTGWPVRCSRTSAPTSTPTRPPSCCTSRAPVTRRAPGDYAQMAGELARRSYANADAARPLRDGARRQPAGARCHGRRPRATVDARRASCASSPGCSRRRWTPTDAPRGCCGDDPLGRAEVLELQATVHTRTGELATATAGRWAGRGGSSTRPDDGGPRHHRPARQPHRARSASSRSAWGTRWPGRSGRLPGRGRPATRSASCWR